MTHPQQQIQAHARKRSPLPWILLAVLLVAGGVILAPRLLGGGDDPVSAAPVAESTADAMATAANKCDPDRKGTKLSDNNGRLTASGTGKEGSAGISVDALTCILDALQVPGALSSRIHNTSGEDGLLQGSWPGYKVTWTNNESDGIDLTVIRTE